MAKRRFIAPPDDLQWCVKCRRVLGDRGGWFGGQCFCDELNGPIADGRMTPWGVIPTLIQLRDLPGVASIAGLCRQSDRWDYPTVIGTMAALDEVSTRLFAITRSDTLVDDETEFTADEGEEPFTAEEYEARFNATRAPWGEARQFFELTGWNLSDGKGEELICAHWFARQIIAVVFDLVDGACFTPDGSGQWAAHDPENPESEEAMTERLEQEAAAFLARRAR